MAAESHWTVVHTHPGAERWAVRNIARAGYDTYLPLYAVRRRDRARGNHSQLVRLPLFPRYAFVALEDGEPWTPIRYAAGVAKLLMADGHPAYASSAAVEAVQAGDALRATPQPPGSQWAPGAACSLSSGPFKGQEAVICAVDGERAKIGLVFLGAFQEVSVNACDLVKRE